MALDCFCQRHVYFIHTGVEMPKELHKEIPKQMQMGLNNFVHRSGMSKEYHRWG
jgi:hypothetical protein